MTNHPNRYKYQVHLTQGQINWLRRVIDELPLGSVADKRKKDAIEQALSGRRAHVPIPCRPAAI
jgi:hypothetical protein